MSPPRRTDDTLGRRVGNSLGTTTRLMIGAAILAILATAVAVANSSQVAGVDSRYVISALSGISVVLLVVASVMQTLVARRLRHTVLDPIDEMSARLRKMIIAGVNDVRPLDSNAAPEIREVWGNYQKLASAVDRARGVAQAAMDANSARSRTAVDAAMQAEKEKAKGETDPLTHLFNRRRLDDDLARDAAAAAEEGRPFAFVMVDVDHFKNFNDTYGHQKGDEILQGLSNILADSVRGIDTAYRYGGEEFSLILRDVSVHAAYDIVERIRAKVEAAFAVTDTPMTASFGVSLAPVCARTAADVIATADQALYESKENGRNRVSMAPPTTAATPAAGHEETAAT